ncbi:hypothetical protein [Actinoplanes sp. TFC3]|uniref:hypothetical protein n=1 Tax=Actinoplanes sp. TFC3 TaxID=1710355 RepID=UPI000835D124|nr:hypothetical protein [Actinoplanes sp. TFC3]
MLEASRNLWQAEMVAYAARRTHQKPTRKKEPQPLPAIWYGHERAATQFRQKWSAAADPEALREQR